MNAPVYSRRREPHHNDNAHAAMANMAPTAYATWIGKLKPIRADKRNGIQGVGSGVSFVK